MEGTQQRVGKKRAYSAPRVVQRACARPRRGNEKDSLSDRMQSRTPARTRTRHFPWRPAAHWEVQAHRWSPSPNQ